MIKIDFKQYICRCMYNEFKMVVLINMKENIDRTEGRIFGFVLKHTNKVLHQFINRKFKEEELDVTIEQWPILMMLTLTPNATQQELAEETNKDKTTITSILNVMVKNGLIERQPDVTDKRKNSIQITLKGNQVREKVFRVFQKCNSEILNGIPEDEMQVALSVLFRILGNVGQSDQLNLFNKHLEAIKLFKKLCCWKIEKI